MNDYSSKLHPINNSDLTIHIPKKDIIKITNASGIKYENSKYVKSNDVVVPIEPTTGKINYLGFFEIEGAKKKTLFNALKTLPSANIKYAFISADETDNTFIHYIGKFNTKFAGDLYTVVFNLTIKFKDGKIKYNYHDFMFCFDEIKYRESADWKGSYTVGEKNKNNSKSLELFYRPGYREDKFWKSIYNNMEDAVKNLNKLCEEFSSEKDGF